MLVLAWGCKLQAYDSGRSWTLKNLGKTGESWLLEPCLELTRLLQFVRYRDIHERYQVMQQGCMVRSNNINHSIYLVPSQKIQSFNIFHKKLINSYWLGQFIELDLARWSVLQMLKKKKKTFEDLLMRSRPFWLRILTPDCLSSDMYSFLRQKK